MSGTALEALKSDDLDLIKKTRTAFKGKLTRAVNTLIAELRKDESGKYLLEEIYKYEVDSMISNLQKVKDIVEELHLRYTIKRVHKDGTEEIKLEELDNNYIAAVEKTHHETVKVYHEYCSQFRVQQTIDEAQKLLNAEIAQYPDKLKRFKACAAEYESAHAEALLVVQSKAEFVQRTASLQQEILRKEYDLLLSMGQDMLSLVSNVPGAISSDIESFDCSKMKLTHRKTLTLLETTIKSLKSVTKKC